MDVMRMMDVMDVMTVMAVIGMNYWEFLEMVPISCDWPVEGPLSWWESPAVYCYSMVFD